MILLSTSWVLRTPLDPPMIQCACVGVTAQFGRTIFKSLLHLLPLCPRTQVLDVARQHAQMLDAAATELFQAHMRRQADFCPMFDVHTALEVLSTGR